MNQKRWLAATNTETMFKHLGPRASDRKLRLFACACVRRGWHFVTDKRLVWSLPVIEGYAEGTVNTRDRGRAHKLCGQVLESERLSDQHQCLGAELWNAARKTLERTDDNFGESAAAAFGWVEHANGGFFKAKQAERKQQTALVWEIFGNPFRRVEVEPSWLTSDVRALAAGIEKDQAFDRMPILADALQDAGCDSDDLLNHLRDPNATHVRGCWALDLVLGKS